MKSTHRPPRRYPIAFEMRYKATSKHGTLHGFGQTTMMSSRDIVFAPGDGLVPGTRTEIAIAWPFLLDGHIRLQLTIEAVITSSQDSVAEARILKYHFRTRRPVESERTEPARVEMHPMGAGRPLAAAHA